jgi:hypothetical protein
MGAALQLQVDAIGALVVQPQHREFPADEELLQGQDLPPIDLPETGCQAWTHSFTGRRLLRETPTGGAEFAEAAMGARTSD